MVLPAPFGPISASMLPFHLEVDILDGKEAAEALAELPGLENDAHRVAAPSHGMNLVKSGACWQAQGDHSVPKPGGQMRPFRGVRKRRQIASAGIPPR